jgi:hypothetical protein
MLGGTRLGDVSLHQHPLLARADWMHGEGHRTRDYLRNTAETGSDA